MNNEKLGVLRQAFICIVSLSIICGIVYPLFITGVSQLLFNNKAKGSIITVDINGEKVNVGSEFIGQQFTNPKYLIGRPMTESKGPTNISAVSEEQSKLVHERIDWFHEIDPTNKKDIPMDLVTVSGSGVDPEISKEAAEYQVSRIARERGVSENEVKSIIDNYTEEGSVGEQGEERVNVLKVNLALDKLI